MGRRTGLVFGVWTFLLLVAVFGVVLNVQVVRGSATIYIRTDGSIDPPTAPISSVDKVTYTFTDNIYNPIVVERNNIMVDGAGYTIQGTESGNGIDLSNRSNLIVKNTTIRDFNIGIYLNYTSKVTLIGNNITANNWYGIAPRFSSSNIISGNNIANNEYGIMFSSSSNNNRISGNNITANNEYGISLIFSSNNNDISGNNIANNSFGIWLYDSSNNSISGNNITANNSGILLRSSSNNRISGNNITANNACGISIIYSSNNNSISGNNITNNAYGIRLYESSKNSIHHNNFRDNAQQIHIETPDYHNYWDNDYPSGGNYWSNYIGVDLYSGPYQNETGSDGIGDTQYVIDENNRDRYPLMNPWTPPPQQPVETFPMWAIGLAIAAIGIGIIIATALIWKKTKTLTIFLVFCF